MNREEKERHVIDLYYNQGKTFREIAKELRVSFTYIAFVIRKKEAEEEEKNNTDNNTNKDQQEPSSSIATKAYDLFSKGKTPVEVAITLNLPASKVSKLYREYWDLKGFDILNTIHKETNGNTWPLWKLYQQLVKKRGMSIAQVVNAVDIAIDKLPYMESLYEQVKDQVDKMQRTIQRLENYSHTLNDEIASAKVLLNSYHVLCERKRKEAENLNNELSRLEVLVSHFKIKDEGYSDLKQIVKENVKVVLSEKRVLISISFVALIQTLKNDPQIVNIIYNMPSAKDEQHKDNNITQYLESNKDKIIDLAEKNYQNLVEALTNNSINTVVVSPNPTLSLP